MKIKFPKKIFKRRRNKAISCNLCLIVHGTHLLYAKHQNIIANTDGFLTATEIAKAAQCLLPDITKQQGIALALPSSEFVVTTLQSPKDKNINIENIMALNMSSLLPGMTEPLLHTERTPARGKALHTLWMPTQRAEELFQAFEKVGLFLTCILPRSLLVIKNAKSSSQIYDEDDHTITCLEWSNNVIQRWIHTSKVDCCDETEFQEQLDESLLNFSHKIQRKTTISDWDKESMPTSVIYHYAFMPPSAIAHVAEAVKQKIRYSALILIGLFIISLLGTVGYAIQYEQELKQNLRVLKRRTIAVSQLRMEAAEIEEKLAPIKEFPKQPVLTILESLNSIVPKDSWITHFHLEEGLVKIGGSSANPTALIEILSNHPDIYNVEQSGTFSGKRFNISFKLKIFDQNYWVKYFSRSQ